MDNDLIERIEEIRKIKAKEADICARIKEEGSSYRKRCCDEKIEFEQYVAKEKRKLERRLAGEREAFEAKQEDKENELNEKIKLMRDEIVKLREKVDSLGKNVASIRLGDLREELASLAGINTTDIKMSTCSAIIIDEAHSTEEMYEMMKDRTTKKNGDIWHLILYTNSFRYEMKLNADLNSKQADGKTFLEHCVAAPWGPCGKETCLYVNINPGDLIANIPLSYLGKEDFSWYPDYLITQAIINCVEKSKEKEIFKKRSRKLSDETNK